MSRLANAVGVALLSASLAVVACSPARPSAPTDVDNSTTAPQAQAAVLFLAATATATATVLACSTPGRGVIADGHADACLPMIARGGTARDGRGRGFALGERSSLTCADTTIRADVLAIADVEISEDYQPRTPVDPATELLVWPAERAGDLLIAPEGDDDRLDRGAAARLLQAYADREHPDDELQVARVAVVGALHADLDGDGVDDSAWAVDGSPDDDFGVRGIIASLSSRPDLELLRGSPIFLTLLGAIDLDGDGRAELVDAEWFGDALDVRVSEIIDGVLVARSAGHC